MDRAAIINELIGRPYDLGGRKPGSLDCYGCAREVQWQIYGREMPPFEMPGSAGRMAIAAAISAHPERLAWREVDHPADGALVTMARNGCGYHIGTWMENDGGLIIHALETVGVVADTIPSMQAVGWRRFRFHVPN
jgi:cell wall-associated NlpC family hydrolase